MHRMLQWSVWHSCLMFGRMLVLCLNFLIHHVPNAAVKCMALLLHHVWEDAGSFSVQRLGILCAESCHLIQFLQAYRGADKSVAWPGRKQANVSLRMAWISFGSLPCRKKTWWQLTPRCCWNHVRPWHASELVSFLVGLRTYQQPGILGYYSKQASVTSFPPLSRTLVTDYHNIWYCIIVSVETLHNPKRSHSVIYAVIIQLRTVGM